MGDFSEDTFVGVVSKETKGKIFSCGDLPFRRSEGYRMPSCAKMTSIADCPSRLSRLLHSAFVLKRVCCLPNLTLSPFWVHVM